MAIRARFIGIDRYKSPTVRDLGGAKRDAIALWSLFKDSLADVDALLIKDDEATANRVYACLNETLGSATADDTVIFYFAGHGSRDHRIITHDYDKDRAGETSLGMDQIAEAFRQTQAKIALCILDCCFSGEAPARVLEDPSIHRSVLSGVNAFTGGGRILITASAEDEPALEDPRTRHGLFTKALIDALQSAEANASATSLTSNVMDRVRADALRLGCVQTPQFLGSISGGLGLPLLRAGDLFHQAFPENRGLKVGKDITELSKFGIPVPITEAWKSLYPSGLNKLQLSAINDFRVLNGESLLVIAPTSAGKTLIGELSAAKAAADERKAIFLLPYKALANEKFDQFSITYGETIGLRVVRCTGDYQDQISEVLCGKYDIALFTYEMFLNLSVAKPEILNQVGLVVVDEAQFITDPSRGIVVELLLTNLLAARERGISPQLVCLSAVIGGINHFDKWLDAKCLLTDERPVELIEGVIDRSGSYQFKTPEGEIRTEQLIPRTDIVQRGQKPSAQDVIVPLVKKLVGDGEQVIVFRNQRGNAQGCGKYLARDLGLPPATEVINWLPKRDLSAASQDLRTCLMGGTAFHNANLSKEERAAIERGFRIPGSGIRVLGATTTVAAGINTPASTVIIAEQEFMGEDGRFFTVAEYKNMAGRAGRLGFNEKGKAIIYAETSQQRQQLFNRYVTGQLGQMTSSFSPAAIDTWVLRLLAQVKSVRRDLVSSLLSNTYGGYLAAQLNPNWKVQTEQMITNLLSRMESLALVESDGDNIRLSLLGRACGRSGLPFQSAMRLVEFIKSMDAQTLSSEMLLCILQVIPEASPYTPMLKGNSEAIRPGQASSRFGNSITQTLQRSANDNADWYARCKRAAILGDWIDGVTVERIEQKFASSHPFFGTITGGHVRQFADTTRLYLRASADIAILVHPSSALVLEEIDQMMRRLEAGLPVSALPILDILPDLHRGQYLELHSLGGISLEALLAIGEDVLTDVIGFESTTKLLKQEANS
ncbi:MAG: DEAD/DEAH box helicase [Armatimonadetes bacterium]|nr:DEAD/DEAH box helicase [Armatimonadota bacterium]